MQEVPDYQEIFDASPEHMKLLDSLECPVECDYIWNEFRGRLQLYVMIDDKTSQKEIKTSWQYILVMREMLHNFQGPFDRSGQFMWQGFAHHLHTPQGGSLKPRQIAVRLNKAVDMVAAVREKDEWEFQYPEGYPFDNVYVENMRKNWRKYLGRYHEDNG